MKNENLLAISWSGGEIVVGVILVSLSADWLGHAFSVVQAIVLGVGFLVFYALTMHASGFIVTLIRGSRAEFTDNPLFFGFMAGIGGLLSSCLAGLASMALLAGAIFCAVSVTAHRIGKLAEKTK